MLGVKVYLLDGAELSWPWEGCVAPVAAWSSSTGNASKRKELTGTRCLRLPAGGFSLWNKSVSGGSSLPLTVSLYWLCICFFLRCFFLSLRLGFVYFASKLQYCTARKGKPLIHTQTNYNPLTLTLIQRLFITYVTFPIKIMFFQPRSLFYI